MAEPTPAPAKAEAKDQAKAEAKVDGKPKAADKLKSWEDRIKILGVVRYNRDLYKGYLNPSSFESLRPTDFVFKLYAAVWPSAERPAGSLELVVLCGLSLARAWLLQRSSSAWHAMSRAVFQGDASELRRLMGIGAILAILGASYQAGLRLCQERLQIVFRRTLTERIHDCYFLGMNYYHLPNLQGKAAIADPEERLCREVNNVAGRLATIVALTSQALPTLGLFFFQMWRTAGLHYALLPMTYHFLAYEVAQRYFPKDIGTLYRERAQESAEYRRQCGRVQRHGEAIAALGGSAIEKRLLEERFEKVQGVFRRAQWSQTKFDAIFKIAYISGFRPFIYLFVYLTPWLGGGLTASGLGPGVDIVAKRMSDARGIVHMLIEILVAEGRLMTSYAMSVHVQGVCRRVADLISSLERLGTSEAAKSQTTFSESEHIAFKNVEIETPTKNKLVENLCFELPKGTSLLLTGHNGAGKSSIFRCLGGLWTVHQGTISKPSAGSTGLHGIIFYLPQKPYNVYGTLRDQLTYPQEPGEAEINDTYMQELLEKLDLGHLMENFGADQVLNWEETLSLGEQQRLAMARLFYHQPQYAVLDECTSAVDSRVEMMLYDKCIESGITYITISHRPALKAFHEANLHLTGDGKGGWTWNRIDRQAEMRQMVSSRAAMEKLQNGGTPRTTKGRRASGGQDNVFGEELPPLTERYTAEARRRQRPRPEATTYQNLLRLAKIALPGTFGQMGVLVVLIATRTMFRELHVQLQGKMAAGMIQGMPKQLFVLTLAMMVQDLFATGIETTAEWVQRLISLEWHRRLQADITNLWIGKRRFFTLSQIDGRIKDADQILSQEMSDLAELFSSVWGSLVKPIVDIAWFSFRLSSLVGSQGIFQLNAYSIVVWLLLRWAMPDHSAIAKREKETESKYRFVHGRLRDHAESIAFFGGGPAERRIADGLFQEVCEAATDAKHAETKYRFLHALLARDPDEYMKLLTAPMMVQAWLQLGFSQNPKIAKTKLVLGATYVDGVVDQTITAFSQLSSVFEDASKLAAAATRVMGLRAVLEDLDSADAPVKRVDSIGEDLAFKGVDLVTPTGLCLAKEVNFSLPPGNSLMVTGRNGCGKSALFRVLAGMWPTVKGSVHLPGNVMLVPQRVYSVSGTLLDQVTYPEQHRPSTPELEARAVDALQQVGIAYLAKREGWTMERRWEDVLSLGEQQRLGLARLFFHKPSVGVLDECTSAVSVDAEERALAALQGVGISCVTISQRLALEQFHQFELKLGAPTPTGWWFGAIQQSNT